MFDVISWATMLVMVRMRRVDAMHSMVEVARCYAGEFFRDQTDDEVLRVLPLFHNHELVKMPEAIRGELHQAKKEVRFWATFKGSVFSDIPDARKAQHVACNVRTYELPKGGAPVHYAGQSYGTIDTEAAAQRPTSRRAQREA